MTNRTTIFALGLLVAVVVSLGVFAGKADAAQCLSPQETRQAIENGRAAHIASITAAVRRVARGDVINVKLCKSGNRLVYHIVTLSRQGAVSRFVIDAKTGAILSRSGS